MSLYSQFRKSNNKTVDNLACIQNQMFTVDNDNKQNKNQLNQERNNNLLRLRKQQAQKLKALETEYQNKFKLMLQDHRQQIKKLNNIHQQQLLDKNDYIKMLQDMVDSLKQQKNNKQVQEHNELRNKITKLELEVNKKEKIIEQQLIKLEQQQNNLKIQIEKNKFAITNRLNPQPQKKLLNSFGQENKRSKSIIAIEKNSKHQMQPQRKPIYDMEIFQKTKN